MDRCGEEVGELEELITLDVLNHYLYKVLVIMIIFVINFIIISFHTLYRVIFFTGPPLKILSLETLGKVNLR